MAKRICDVCGKDKDVSGGKTCEKGHFVCKDDVYSGVIIISEKAHCPICKKPLRSAIMSSPGVGFSRTFCSRCGNKLDAGVKFCAGCGRPAGSAASSLTGGGP